MVDGIDPSEHRKATIAAWAERAANSFEGAAHEWYAMMSPTWNAAHGALGHLTPSEYAGSGRDQGA